MEIEKIKEQLQIVFRQVFHDNELIIHEEMTASNIDGWDSLTHMILIAEIEKAFAIKFRLKELNLMKNIGGMISIIQNKM